MSSEDGWPDVPGDTALTIRIPEADAFVRAPFPAHITVLYPFLPAARITPEVHAELAALFADRPPFVLTFAEFRRYPGVLYLPPAPDHPVRALTRAVRERWPEAVPYRGVFGPEGLDPHLTLANDEGPETYESGVRRAGAGTATDASGDGARRLGAPDRDGRAGVGGQRGVRPRALACTTCTTCSATAAPPAQVLRAASTALSRRT